jgi:predicted ATPase/DNA-binding CsgD family transcriptional regulator
MARRTRRPGNLPAEPTSFIGRRRELAEIRRKLAGARLVSLIGPGGVGKSRLGLRLATDLGRGFRDGPWLVELAEIGDGDLVVYAALAALDLRDQAGRQPSAVLLDHLRDRELLLLVDNCEHLLEAAAQLVGDVIRAAPGARVIATSREPLGVPGESVVPVPPLDLPSARPDQPLHRLGQNEAVMLFVERAEAASGSFELTAANQSAVVDACRQLDGLPLAIELAAVRTRVLTPSQILDRLTDRFALLTGGGRAALPRHQTLRTTIDWSHELLAPEERVLLRRLCAFAGRFTLDDVEAVCITGGEPAHQALGLVSSLVDKSLVIKEEARSVACYRLHETMREYAGLKLREAGEQEAIELRAADYYVSACRRRAANAHSRLLAWLEWIDLEIDNIRAVLRRCLTCGDSRRGLDIARSLGWYWFTRATTEGGHWLDRFLALGVADPTMGAWVVFMRGFLAVIQGDPATARAALEDAIVAARQTGHDRLLSDSLTMASIAANMNSDRVTARRRLEEATELTPRLGDPAAKLGLIQAQAFNGFFEGDLATVKTVSTEGVRISRETGDVYRLTMMLMNRGNAALFESDLDTSRPLLTEAMRCARETDDRVAVFYLLDALGCVAAGSGQAATAARLLGAAETIRTGAGARIMPFMTPLLDQARDTAAGALGVTRFEAEFKAGTDLSRDDAIRLALGEPGRTVGPGSGDTGAAVLGKRELEVARLVGEGLTNKEIGARLFISESTVASHVRGILNKLGFNSRTQIASWSAGQ